MRIINENVDIIKYLPDFIQNFKEIKHITNTENVELNLIWKKLKKNFQNQFIETCDHDGVVFFEKLLNIKSDDNIELNIRKFNILTNWGTDLPYTYLKLIEKLNIISGGNEYKIDLDTDKYIIKINIKNLIPIKKKILAETIKQVIPCNMQLVLADNEWEIVFNLRINVFTGFSEYKNYKIGEL